MCVGLRAFLSSSPGPLRSSRDLHDRDKNPQPGDYLVIVYFGERETRDGRKYKHYGMTVIRPGSPVTTDAARVTPVAVNGGSTESLGVSDADVPF